MYIQSYVKLNVHADFMVNVEIKSSVLRKGFVFSKIIF